MAPGTASNPLLNSKAPQRSVPIGCRRLGQFQQRAGHPLNEKWGIEAAQARYREDGSWYATLSSFPAALIDAHGYVRFKTKQDYLLSPYLKRGKQITVPKHISGIPGYVLVDESDETALLDVRKLYVCQG